MGEIEMSKPMVHRSRKSLWSGKRTTLCGIEIPAGQGRSPWFTSPRCPACEAAAKGK